MDDQYDATGSRIDLSSVPEPMRSMLLKQLARMPAPMREQLLREGSPVLDRVIAKARAGAGTATAALPASAAESDSVRGGAGYVQTVRNNSGAGAPTRIQTVSPGDRTSGGAWLVAFILALAAAGYYALNN
jgi:hypothetical protein